MISFEVKHLDFDQLEKVAAEILATWPDVNVFTLQGNLGAGKTELIKYFCKALGVKEETNSPTFALINEYRADGKSIYHFDLYRIEDEDEAFDIGIEEYLYSGSKCFIEWPEKAASHLPENFVSLKIEVNKENKTRTIYVKYNA